MYISLHHLFAYVCFCVYAHTHVCIYVCICVCLYVWMHGSIETWTFTEPEACLLVKMIWLIGPSGHSVSAYLGSALLNYPDTPGSLPDCWGSALRPSCLWRKQLTGWSCHVWKKHFKIIWKNFEFRHLP